MFRFIQSVSSILNFTVYSIFKIFICLNFVKFQIEENAIKIWNYTSFKFVCGFCLYCPWRCKDTCPWAGKLEKAFTYVCLMLWQYALRFKNGYYLFHYTANLVTTCSVYVTNDMWKYDHLQVDTFMGKWPHQPRTS